MLALAIRLGRYPYHVSLCSASADSRSSAVELYQLLTEVRRSGDMRGNRIDEESL